MHILFCALGLPKIQIPRRDHLIGSVQITHGIFPKKEKEKRKLYRRQGDELILLSFNGGHQTTGIILTKTAH